MLSYFAARRCYSHLGVIEKNYTRVYHCFCVRSMIFYFLRGLVINDPQTDINSTQTNDVQMYVWR